MGHTQQKIEHYSIHEYSRIKVCATFHKNLTQRILQKTACAHYALYYKTPLPVSAPKIYLIDNLDYSCRLEYDQKKLWMTDPVLHINSSDEVTRWNNTSTSTAPSILNLVKKSALTSKTEAVTLSYPMQSGSTVLLTLIWAPPYKLQLAINEVYDNTFPECRIAAHEIQSLINPAHRPILNLTKLNFREIKIMRLLADGLTSEQVADKIYVTRATIYFHVKQFTKKMNCSTRSEAIIKAALLKLI